MQMRWIRVPRSRYLERAAIDISQKARRRLRWFAAHQAPGMSVFVDRLGAWRRDAYTRFDMDSLGYQDMVFFHPFVRRVFFDTAGASAVVGEKEALLCCYLIPIPEGKKLWFVAVHYSAVVTVALLAFGALAFAIYVVASNWSDYRDILIPRQSKIRLYGRGASLRKGP